MRVGVHAGPFLVSGRVPGTDRCYHGTGPGPSASSGAAGVLTVVCGPGALVGFTAANILYWHGWHDLVNERSLNWTVKGFLISPVVLIGVLAFALAWVADRDYDLFSSPYSYSYLDNLLASVAVGLLIALFAFLGVLCSWISGGHHDAALALATVGATIALIPVLDNVIRVGKEE
jgi:hypothetical protein